MIDSTKLVVDAYNHGANQRLFELGWFVEIVDAHRPRNLLEVGCERGGTLWVWCQIAHDDAQVTSVDMDHSALDRPYEGYPARDAQRIKFVSGDSKDPRVFEDVVDWIDDPLDFLFIDGGHDYETVKSDFDKFSALVAPGGIVGFHDVSPIRGGADDAHVFWSQEIAPNFKCEMCVDPRDTGMGTGVVYL